MIEIVLFAGFLASLVLVADLLVRMPFPSNPYGEYHSNTYFVVALIYGASAAATESYVLLSRQETIAAAFIGLAALVMVAVAFFASLDQPALYRHWQQDIREQQREKLATPRQEI